MEANRPYNRQERTGKVQAEKILLAMKGEEGKEENYVGRKKTPYV